MTLHVEDFCPSTVRLAQLKKCHSLRLHTLNEEIKKNHTYISKNELTDKAAKKEARNTERAVINASKTQISLSFIKKDIDKIAQEE